MRERLVRLGIAVVLLGAFIGDLRMMAPVMAAVLALAAARGIVGRTAAVAGVALLLGATVAFAVDSEVLAWALVLVVGAGAGVSVATTSRVYSP